MASCSEENKTVNFFTKIANNYSLSFTIIKSETNCVCFSPDSSKIAINLWNRIKIYDI